MTLGRFLRTVRHLPADQWYQRTRCRGRRVTMRLLASPYHMAMKGAASRLPLPDPGMPGVLAAAAPVLALQRAVHGTAYGDVRRGRFTLLNETFDFGSPEKISWRGGFHEGNNPLRRMTLAYMGYAVPLLARGVASDLDAVAAILRTLEDQNRWTRGGVFRDVWNAYTASHRLINLLVGMALFRDRGGRADPEAENAILEHVRFCAAFVMRNLELDLKYNHLLKNYVALAVYCASLPEPPPQFDFLRMAVPNSVRQDVLRDGGHVERSPMYHALSLLDLKLLRATGLFAQDWRLLLDRTIARMEEALGVMTHPDGDIALFNDAWLGEAPRSTDLIDPRAVDETARLPDTGYVRIGRGGDAILFDCGACGPEDNPGHAHGDYLSIELSVGGRRLVVDPGVPTYTAGALRDASRSARSHNGPRVDGLTPLEAWKSFRVGRRGDADEILDSALNGIAPLWCAGWQSGYAYRGVKVRRFAGLWPGEGALICDLWLGRRRGPEASGFLIPADWHVASTSPLTLARDDQLITVKLLAGTMGNVSSESYWTHFGVPSPATHIDVLSGPAGPVRRAATWFTWADRPPPPPSDLEIIFERLAAA